VRAIQATYYAPGRVGEGVNKAEALYSYTFGIGVELLGAERRGVGKKQKDKLENLEIPAIKIYRIDDK